MEALGGWEEDARHHELAVLADHPHEQLLLNGLAARDIGQATRLAERLSALGCGFALDDFGTGYGSFTYLKHLPVDYIKIDMEFVRNLRAGSPDVQVVSAIIDVARKFGIQTVAEGVESQAQVEKLRDLGCLSAQGYHFAKPLHADGIDALLRVASGSRRWQPIATPLAP